MFIILFSEFITRVRSHRKVNQRRGLSTLITSEDAVVSRAVRRRHCVGGGALVNFGRRRRAAGPKKSAAAARPGKTVFF